MMNQYEIYKNDLGEYDVRPGSGKADEGAVAFLGGFPDDDDARACMERKLQFGALTDAHWTPIPSDFVPMGYIYESNGMNRSSAAHLVRLVRCGQTENEYLEEQAALQNAEMEFFLMQSYGGYHPKESRATYPEFPTTPWD